MSGGAAPRSSRAGDARARAAEILVRIESEGAWAAPVLDAAIDREPPLSGPERALCTELVYGVLRCAAALDAALDTHARAGSMAKLDAFSRAVLRIAAYQVLALERIPTHAAVNAAVEALKHSRSPGLSRFANAVLRKVVSSRTTEPNEAVRVALAVQSVPASVVKALRSGLETDAAVQSVLRAFFQRENDVGLRVNLRKTTVAALRERLEQEAPGVQLRAGSLLPNALRYAKGGVPTKLPSHREGLFSVQEEGAQCVVAAAEVRPGMRVLDACAGRGNKTGALAEALDGQGLLHAAELYPGRMEQIEPELTRLGLLGKDLSFLACAVDLTQGQGALARARPAEGYDVVLLDAPCSGLGTLGRRPEVLVRGKSEQNKSEIPLPVLQKQLLDRVSTLVRPGGTLVYAVCTLTKEEGIAQGEAFVSRDSSFAWADGSEQVPAKLRSSQVILRPDEDGTDGFVVLRFRKKS